MLPPGLRVESAANWLLFDWAVKVVGAEGFAPPRLAALRSKRSVSAVPPYPHKLVRKEGIAPSRFWHKTLILACLLFHHIREIGSKPT